MRIEKIIRIAVLMSAVAIAPAAIAQPNVFLMVDLVQEGGPAAIQSSTQFSKSKGSSYSDQSASAYSTKASAANSESSSSGSTSRASAAAARSSGGSSAAARSSARGSSASRYRSAAASSSSASAASSANVQYETHDDVNYGRTVYAQTGGDSGLHVSEALSLVSSGFLQTEVDITYPEMILAEFFDGDLPSFASVRKHPRFSEISSTLARQNVSFIVGATLTLRGTGGMVSSYGCQGTLNAVLLPTNSKNLAVNFSVSGASKSRNLEDCQRALAIYLSDELASKVRPKL